jgi:hypothetical protein
MSNPNPKNKFQKGDKRAGRPPGGGPRAYTRRARRRRQKLVPHFLFR